MPKKNLIRVIIATVIVLLVPLIAQLTVGTGIDGRGFNWTLGDFAIMGVLIFIFASLVDIAWRKLDKYRFAGVAIAIFLFLWVWAELAVGVFTNLGN